MPASVFKVRVPISKVAQSAIVCAIHSACRLHFRLFSNFLSCQEDSLGLVEEDLEGEETEEEDEDDDEVAAADEAGDGAGKGKGFMVSDDDDGDDQRSDVGNHGHGQPPTPKKIHPIGASAGGASLSAAVLANAPPVVKKATAEPCEVCGVSPDSEASRTAAFGEDVHRDEFM